MLRFHSNNNHLKEPQHHFKLLGRCRRFLATKLHQKPPTTETCYPKAPVWRAWRVASGETGLDAARAGRYDDVVIESHSMLAREGIMPAATFKARETARAINAQLSKAGLSAKVTDKQVRSWVRDNIAAYDDEGYTAHVYTAAQHAAIVKALVARRTGAGARGTTIEARATAASKGRTPSKRESAARAKDATPKVVTTPATE